MGLFFLIVGPVQPAEQEKEEKFMEKYAEFLLPDGSNIIIETDELALGEVSAGRRKMNKIVQGEFGQGAEHASKAASIILDKVRNTPDAPDEVEVTFGLKASSDLGMLVVAKNGTEASYSIKLKWNRGQSRGIAAKS